MVRYTAELSKSNRSSCKRCKEKIEKDAVRIGTHVTNADDITMVCTIWLLTIDPSMSYELCRLSG